MELQRSQLNRSCGLKTTLDAGFLNPIFVDEVLPGDTLTMRATQFGRLATPLFPTLDNLYIDTHWWFVPNRLLWENWERMQGSQDDPADSIDFEVPQVTPPGGGWAHYSLADYFGLPISIAGSPAVNALHFRAYNLIYNEWYRSEYLQDSADVPLGDGPDVSGIYPVRKRGKRADYFTSCLPWPQKGPAVPLAVGGTAPVIADPSSTTPNTPRFQFAGGASNVHLGSDVGPQNAHWLTSPGVSLVAPTWQESGLMADLASATGANVNHLRYSVALQRILERDARAGTRYTEILKSFWQVDSPDGRLQRPEFLGGGTQRITMTPVPNTSEATAQNQGDLAAYGVVSGSAGGFNHSFVEHGVIIGINCLRADMTYQQGMERMWSRRNRYDFYMPPMAHIGEQPVLNKEIYVSGNPTIDDDVFGYQEAWAEYRYKPSRVTSTMRSAASGSFDPWHLALNFPSLPVLNSSFIEEDPPVDRIIAVPSEDHLLLDMFFDYKSARAMPVFSVPGMMDHF